MRGSTSYRHSALVLWLLLVLGYGAGARGQAPTLDEALDTTNLVWVTGGDALWFGQTTNTYDATDAARSGVIGPGQASWLETTVVGPATVSFWSGIVEPTNSATSSQVPGFPPRLPRHSFLSFRVNANASPGMPAPPSGAPAWALSVTDLPAGSNVLRWTFSTDAAATNGDYTGFVDQVTIAPARPLQFTYQPQDVTIFARELAVFSVSAIGTPPLSYQWLKNGTNVPGETNSWMVFNSASTNDSGVYSVLVTNSQGSLLSSNGLLSVLPPAAPILGSEPADALVYVGQSFTWWVYVQGSPPFAYQWRKDGTNLPGPQSGTLSFTNLQPSDAGAYSVEVRNEEGSVVSSNAVLAVLPSTGPVITAQPVSLNVAAGSVVALSVRAEGSPGPQYEWYKNGTAIPAPWLRPQGNSLSLSNIAGADAGLYAVKVSNVAGSVWSQNALLTVLPPPVASGVWSQKVDNVTVVNDLAYLAQGQGGVGILNVSNPASPVLVGSYDTPGEACAIQVAGGMAYVADGSAGLQILGVTNPANPVKLGSLDTAGYAWDVFVVSNLAYVADADAGLQIFDVSDPAHIIRVGGLVTNMSAAAVQVAGDRAYVACPLVISPIGHPMTAGLQMIDIRDPAQPVLLGVTSGDANGVAVFGNLVLTAGANSGVWCYEVTDPFLLLLRRLWGLGPWSNGLPTSAYGVSGAGSAAFIAAGTGGLWVVDVGRPSAPVNVARFGTTGPAQKVAVVGQRAYVAMGDGGLEIIDLPADLGVQPSPRLTVSRASGGQLRLDGPVGAQFTIESADQLQASQWQTLQAVRLTNAPFILDVPVAPVGQRFFRARVWLP